MEPEEFEDFSVKHKVIGFVALVLSFYALIDIIAKIILKICPSCL